MGSHMCKTLVRKAVDSGELQERPTARRKNRCATWREEKGTSEVSKVGSDTRLKIKL